MSRVPFAFEASTKPPRDGNKFALRFWANRHARLMELTYSVVSNSSVMSAWKSRWLRLRKQSKVLCLIAACAANVFCLRPACHAR